MDVSVLNQIPSFPEGWYFVTSRKNLLEKKLIRKIWMGEEIIVWCNDAGDVCVADAFCPHLGADLGPESGGRVQNGRLVCPFHGFEFETGGSCVSTPFAPPPKTAKLKLYDMWEMNGMIFAWWGINGRPPQWNLPEHQETRGDWTDLAFETMRFPGHPQETTENSVDLAHLRYVHGFENVKRMEPLKIDGHYLRSHFELVRSQNVGGLKIHLNVCAKAEIYGLGVSNVTIHERSIDMHIKFYMFTTPVDGKYVDVVLATQVRQLRKPKRAIIGMGFLPVSFRTSIMNRLVLFFHRKEVMDDVFIWQNKRYATQPRLSKSDGEIGRYRRYCRQFYPS